MDPHWKHPFTCIAAGPTGCGKTTFVTRLLRNSSTMIDPSPERVTWYYGEWQSAYENLDIPNLHLEEGLPTSFDASKCNIVVLDDLMAETDERVTNLFTKKSHHCNTSCNHWHGPTAESIALDNDVVSGLLTDALFGTFCVRYRGTRYTLLLYSRYSTE